MSSSDTTAPLRIDALDKSYGDNRVLSGFSLEVANGERVAIIGPSGSGKTTVLRMAMGLEVPDAGAVTVFGQPCWPDGLGRAKRLRRLAQVRGPVGMVFQAYNLFPHLTVRDNMLEAVAGDSALTRDAAVQEAETLLDRVGLAAKIDAYPRTMSGGQQQRAAIARALMRKPRLLLLDEITSALDPELVAEVLNVVRAVAAESATTMLLVTHEMRFARDFADRICVMDQGAVIEQGPPERIFDDPRHERTRRFLGALKGTLL